MLLDPRLLIVLAQIFLFADNRGLDVTITSIKSGRNHVRITSQTHADLRAVDMRSKNWSQEDKKALVTHLNKTVGHYGAIGLHTGKRRVIIYEKNAKRGEHFHVQVSRLIKKFTPRKVQNGRRSRKRNRKK